MVKTFPWRRAGIVVFAGVLLAGAAGAAGAVAVGAAATPHWSAGKLVPGLGAIAAGWAVPFSVSCTGPGDCTAGGEYGPGDPYSQDLPLVVTEAGGQWGGATTVSGIPALDGNQYAAVTSVSCAWPGNCAAVGYYLPRQTPDFAFTGQAFVLDQVNGTWQRMRPLAGVTQGENVNAFGPAWALAVSCAPATTSAARAAGLNCLVVGADSGKGRSHGFVVQARHGAWGAAQPVTGLSRLDGTRPSQVNTVSCTATGSCAIGGYYTDGKGRRQAFVGTEVKGGWRNALEVPGTGALNVKGSAETDAVDCPVAGNCTAAGDYLTKSGAAELFVIYETAGSWRSATELPGVARLGTAAAFVDVACAPATCEVGGTMTTKGGGSVGFLVGEVHGRWGAPHLVPGSSSEVTTLSCPAAGQCAAGAIVSPDSGASGIVLDQVNGVWGKPVTVDPTNGLQAAVTALSCGAVRNCAAVGFLAEGEEGGPLATIATEGQLRR